MPADCHSGSTSDSSCVLHLVPTPTVCFCTDSTSDSSYAVVGKFIGKEWEGGGGDDAAVVEWRLRACSSVLDTHNML